MKRLTRHLLSTSQEVFILSLEVYNKPTIQYRVEAFCFLFCNAWELLLKAKILETEKRETAICYRKRRGQPRRTLSLRDCLKKVYQDENNPIRRNIEDITEVRDAAVHFIVPELEAVYQGLLQAGVLNYVKALDEWFDRSILEKCTPALLSLVADLANIEPAKLKKKYGKTLVSFIDRESDRIDETESQLSSTQYRIPVEYKLVLTKSPDNADISLFSGDGATRGVIVEVAKDLQRTHPYRQTEAIEEVKERVEENIKFNSYSFQAFLFKDRIKGQAQYHHFITKPETHRYSEKLVELIVRKVEQDPEYIDRARASYSHYIKKQQQNGD